MWNYVGKMGELCGTVWERWGNWGGGGGGDCVGLAVGERVCGKEREEQANILFELTREAEVSDLDVAVQAQQHVAGGEVAVDALALHKMLHARRHLPIRRATDGAARVRYERGECAKKGTIGR